MTCFKELYDVTYPICLIRKSAEEFSADFLIISLFNAKEIPGEPVYL